MIPAAWNAEVRIAQDHLRNWNDRTGPIVRKLQTANPVRSPRLVRIARMASNVRSAWTNQLRQIVQPARIFPSVRTVPSVRTNPPARTTHFGRIDRIDRRIGPIARIGRTLLNNPNTNSPVLGQLSGALFRGSRAVIMNA